MCGMVWFTCICLSSVAGRRVCSRLPTRLLTLMHVKHTTLPEDEPMRFETCRRHHSLNTNLQNYAFCWFMFYTYITKHGAQKLRINYI
jgi:hypothetical protein